MERERGKGLTSPRRSTSPYLRDAKASVRMTSKEVAVKVNARNKATASNIGLGGWIGYPTNQLYGSTSRLSPVEPHGKLAPTDRLSPGW